MIRSSFAFICFLFACKTGLAQTGAINLLTEGLKDPVSVDAPYPRFSWQLTEKNNKPVLQTAYEVEVDTMASNGKSSILWSSGKILSGQALYVPYKGAALHSQRSYFWKVRVWDDGGTASNWSETAHWTMGLLSPSDWQAKWIAPAGRDSVYYPAPILRTGFQLNKEIREATAYITSHGFYEAQINGHKVGDSYLTPGWTSYNKRLQYQVYDVKNLLQQGANAIGVTLGSGWYRSPLGPSPRPNFYGKSVALLM